MNREVPRERLHGLGGSWDCVIISIGVGTLDRKSNWLYWTAITHRMGGVVVKSERGAPAEGWRAHWAKYRKDHPELEPYWVDSAYTPSWGQP